MARRSEHTQQQIRELVLNAAERIVVEDGIEALTVRKIAMEIGYTVGSVYMVFANVQDLLRHVSGRSLDRLAERLRLLPAEGSVEERIMALAMSYLDFASEEFNRWRIMFCRETPAEPLPEWYADKLRAVLAPLEQLFRELCPERGDEHARLAARTFWGGVHGLCMMSLHRGLDDFGVEEGRQAMGLLVGNFVDGCGRG